MGIRFRFISASPLLLNILPSVRCFCCKLFSSSTHLSSLRYEYTQTIPYIYSVNRDSILRLLHLCQNIKHLKQVKSLLIVNGLVEDETLVGEYIRLCFHLGTVELALKIFRKIENPSLFLQNLVIRCLSNHGLYENLLSVYMRCQKLGCSSDNYTFPFVIKACASLNTLRTGKVIHCIVLRTGYERNLVVQTALIDMYTKTGLVETSRILFDKIPQPDLVSWNALLSGYSFNGRDQEVFQVFKQIQEIGLKPNVSTFASLIPVCTRLGTLDIGRSIHGFTIKCGFCLNETLVPALISMYGGGDDLSVSRKLFDLLHEKNVASWNAMISAYTQSRKTSEAFEIYRLMLRENVQPNLVSFVSVIPSCDNIQSGESVHACGIKCGLDQQNSVATGLLSMYAKLGVLDSAQIIFDGMPERSLLSWNATVSGYVQNGLPDVGLTAFYEMQLAGRIPDSVSMVSVLSACAKLKITKLGMSAHAYCLRNGFDSNLNVSNALLTFYSDCDRLSSSLKLFHKMVIRNVVSWNTLISNSVHNGDIETALTFVRQMQQEDVKFDLVTMISILPTYSETEKLVQGMTIHGYAIKSGLSSDVSLINALISMYVNCEDLNAANLLFQLMSLRDVVSWNALLTGYRHNNLHREAMVLFHQMNMEDQKPNFVTLLTILVMCSNQLQVKCIHAYAIRTRDILEPPLITSLMCMYARFENVNLCRLMFERADKSNVTVWNAIMSVYVESKNAKNAVATFREMLWMEMEPDHVTVLTLISACIQLSSLGLGQSVMAYVICKGFENDLLVSNALIDLYARCGYISIARNLFDGLTEKDTVSWSVMINGYGIHGDGEAALALFSQMKSSGFEPDDVTFITILSACSHAGLVDRGRMLFNSMLELHGIEPRMEHYACMVDLLGRTGYLDEAYDLVKRLPCKPSASLLESLLGACGVHGYFQLAEEIGRLLFELDPNNSKWYVMLSNVYAAAGMWTDAGRVRCDMEERRLRKVPGFSLIEVKEYQD
ncbi:Pentatricopeptide repeat [Macleaya cordata]|uniref:Pentatricopeptide repeat n=1 Tax=Macleaya cordata TaxID=56857 RepID=A0A200QJ65_MACCD|nr:Pentatricopeptide repeat [Macleaya cordata]